MSCNHPSKRQFVQWNMDIYDNMKVVQVFCGKCGKILDDRP